MHYPLRRSVPTRPVYNNFYSFRTLLKMRKLKFLVLPFRFGLLFVFLLPILVLLHGAAVRGSEEQQQQQQQQQKQLEALSVSPYTLSVGRLEGAAFSIFNIFDYPRFVFSPLAILSTLAIAGEGATGQIRDDLDQLVTDPAAYLPPAAFTKGLSSSPEAPVLETPALDVLSRLYVLEEWVGRDDLNGFKEIMGKKLSNSSAVCSLTEENREKVTHEVNKDVSRITRGRVRQLLQTSPSAFKPHIILIAEAFFRSRLLFPFSVDDLRVGRFAPYGNTTTTGEMVFNLYKVFKIGRPNGVYFYEENDTTVLGLPYEYPGAYLFVYLPRDLDEFEKQVIADPTLLNRLAQAARDAAVEFAAAGETVRVLMPRLYLPADQNGIDVVELLTYLKFGMPDKEKEFVKGTRPHGPLDVALFKHKASFHLEEVGTEILEPEHIAHDENDDALDVEGIKNARITKPFIFEVRVALDEAAPAAADLVVYAGRVAALNWKQQEPDRRPQQQQ